MKRFIESLVCATVLLCMAVPAWAQSTQGKEFWVGLTWAVTPPDPEKAKDADDPYYETAEPYIAVSAQTKGTVITLTNPAYPNWNMTYTTVQDNEWYEFKNIPNQYWYPDDMKTIADFPRYADQTRNWGIKVTASKNISVYSVIRAQFSMDASNILPTTALQSEYYMQDFYPDYNIGDSKHGDVHFDGPRISMATILATEDNTEIDIFPTDNTYQKTNKNTTFTINLNKGQIYYLIGDNHSLMSGTRIMARDNKKIAVFIGDPITRLPAAISARDCLYEQAMPTDYWGTQFIVTRSLNKNANIIGITAHNDGTTIKLNGGARAIATINEGETYYIVLQNSSDPYGKNQQKITNVIGTDYIGKVITCKGDTNDVYIETSCPVAVYNYDTGSNFKKDDSSSETIEKNEGDPSMVWVSPIQQKINNITFGTCTTDKTTMHFLNIVTGTALRDSTQLVGYYKYNGQLTPVSLLTNVTWTTVAGNPTYSYARVPLVNPLIKLEDSYTLTNPTGFIATVYGNGQDESYAYSAGSAAVELGVDINGENFTDNYISETRFCMGTTMNFDANLGGKYNVTRVDWNFGDGISEYNSTTQIPHDYTVPGWYDVEADLYGKQVCTDDATQWLGNLKFSFRIVRPDTVYKDTLICIPEDQSLPADEIETKDDGKCDTVYIIHKHYAKKSTRPYSMTKYVTDGYEMHGHWYTDPYQEDTFYVGQNTAGCDSFEICQLTLKMCLVMDIPEKDLHICPGDPYNLAYTLTKGEMGEMRFISGSTNVVLDPSNSSVSLPTQNMKPGKYQAKITVQDIVCEQTLEFPLNMTVNYPKDIFKFKFNNVLAVYNEDYNGGYVFTNYQWYYNGQPIAGANTSVYHSEVPLEAGEYFVMLTDANGLTMPSCPQDIKEDKIPDYSDLHNAPATKHLINRQIVIRKGTESYNIYGQRVE